LNPEGDVIIIEVKVMMCYMRDSNLRRNSFKYLSKKMAHTISYVRITDKSTIHTC